MAQAKKTAKKNTAEKKPAPKTEVKKKYYAAVGRRKSSIVQARIFEASGEASAEKNVTVNGKELKIFFPLADLQEIVVSPFAAAGKQNFRVEATARGGGIRGQAEAMRLAVARALVKFDEGLRKSLRDSGYLTRDDRAVERKKAGLKKARRAPQWKKR